MNMKNLIKEWADQVINDSVEQSGNDIMNQITGRYMDMGDDNDSFLMPNFNVKTFKWNILGILRNYQTNKIIDADLYTEKEFDSIEDAVAYIRDLENDRSLEKDVDESSEDYVKAKKIGYLGDEKDVAEWLKGDYAKWKQHCLDVFMRLANGDEERAMKWFETYDRLSHSMYGTRFGTDHGYVDSEDVKKELAAELGDDKEAIELIKKIDDKWKSDAKSLSDFYASSSSRGGWTGD